jgi:hypothetical protein
MADFSDDTFKDSHKITTEQLKKMLNLAYELKQALEENNTEKIYEISLQKDQLILLLDYLSNNLSNRSIDKVIMHFLSKFFNKDREEKREEELEQEEELGEEQEIHRNRIMIYEVYKVLNPRKLAGETKIDNFINNVITRGIDEAIKYEGKNFAKIFNKEELEILSSNQINFLGIAKDHGFKR